jgi:hypothetical protein
MATSALPYEHDSDSADAGVAATMRQRIGGR